VASIKANGVLVALTVFWDAAACGWRVIDGNSRRLAAIMAGLAYVPVKVVDAPKNLSEFIKLATEMNVSRAAMALMDIAIAWHEIMVRENFSQKQLAKYLTKSPATVSRTLKIFNDLSPDLRGKVAGKAAYQLARLPLAEQVPMHQRLLAGELTGDQLPDEVNDVLGRTPKTPKYEQFAQDGAEARFPSNWTIKQRQKWVTQLIKWLREQSDGPAGALVPA
jgi:ParB-like chromosome segregation protein Spo0J